MADDYTDNFNLIKPDVGGSDDTWGEKTNANWDEVDRIMKEAQGLAPPPATEVPLIEGVGAVGVSLKYAREDHVHPTGGSGGGGGASVLVSDTPPVGAAPNSLWWESDTGQLYINYDDGTSTQWVIVVPQVSAASIGAATPAYVDAQDALRVAKAGDTMSGPLLVATGDAGALAAGFGGPPGIERINFYGDSGAGVGARIDFNTGNGGSLTTGAGSGAVIRIAPGGVNPTVFRYGGGIDVAGFVTTPTPAQTIKDTTVATTEFVKAWAAPFNAMAYGGIQVNGAMEASQELGTTPRVLSGAGFTGGYVLDGFTAYSMSAAGTRVISCAQTAPPGSPAFGLAFPSCLRMTATTGQASLVSSDQYFISTTLEGYRVSRLGWGHASAGQSITVGFWVYATIAGTVAVAVGGPTNNRYYIQNVAVNAPATWEFKTITVPPCPDGTWNVTNGGSISVYVGLGGGSGAQATTLNAWVSAAMLAQTAATTNFFATTGNIVAITGFFMLPGTEAPSAVRSPLIIRPYDQELLLCKRYWQQFPSFLINISPDVNTTVYPVEMRTSPTITGGGAGFVANGPTPIAMTPYQTTRAFQTLNLDARL